VGLGAEVCSAVPIVVGRHWLGIGSAIPRIGCIPDAEAVRGVIDAPAPASGLVADVGFSVAVVVFWCRSRRAGPAVADTGRAARAEIAGAIPAQLPASPI